MALSQQEELPSSLALSKAEDIGLSLRKRNFPLAYPFRKPRRYGLLSARATSLSLSPSNSRVDKALSKRDELPSSLPLSKEEKIRLSQSKRNFLSLSPFESRRDRALSLSQR